MLKVLNYVVVVMLNLSIFSCNDNAVHDYLQDFAEFVNETEMLYDNDKLDDLTWNEREKTYLEYTGKRFEVVRGKMTDANLKSMQRIIEDYEKISLKQDPLGHLPEFFGF